MAAGRSPLGPALYSPNPPDPGRSRLDGAVAGRLELILDTTTPPPQIAGHAAAERPASAGPAPSARASSPGKPLRIAYLGDPNSRHTRRWMRFFLERGHEIHLLVPAGDRVEVAQDEGIKVHRFEAWPPMPVRGLSALRTARALRRLIGSIRPDLLHAHYVTRYAAAAWLSGFHPYVVTVWGTDVQAAVRTSRRRRLQARLALRAADLVTGGSEHLVRLAIAAGARPERTRYVHFGVDTDRFSPGPEPAALRARLGLEGRRVLLSNRSIAPVYRQGVVVEALASLPTDVVAVMTRHLARAAEVEALEARAARLGVADRLLIADAIDDAEMPDLYRLADVIVSIPESDGGPTTLAEALAVGKPVVATDLPSAREWREEIGPDALVPVGDAGATAGAILAVLKRDRALEADRSNRARQRVLDRADQQRNMELMERLYLDLAGR
jgi:glycosyltransferase involved in cell wall biosynthesis